MNTPYSYSSNNSIPTNLSPINPPSSFIKVFGNFCLDGIIFIGMMLILSVLMSIVLGVFYAIDLSLTRKGMDENTLKTLLENPSFIIQWLMIIISMAFPAFILFLFRQRPTSNEYITSKAALQKKSTYFWALAAGVATFIVSIGLNFIGEKIGITPSPSNEKLIQQGLAESPILLIAFVIAIAPLYEEILFRRVFFGRFLRSQYPIIGMLITGFCFALLHELPKIDYWQQTLQLWFAYTLMGIVFAAVYRHTGTIMAAIMAHSVNNILALIVLFLSR